MLARNRTESHRTYIAHGAPLVNFYLATCLHLLNSLAVQDDTVHRVCVFTRFVDTAIYLESALRDSCSQVQLLTGRLSYVEREQGFAAFAEKGGILVATEVLVTAMPEVAAVIFYDLPLSPAVLETRISRFVKIGRRGPIRIFGFIDESNALVIERLQQKIAQFKQALGDHEIDQLLSTENV